jgi:hypothetical protein
VAEWKKVKIGHNYHARADNQNYSVDYHHIGDTLDACLTFDTVKLYKSGSLVAEHKRLYGRRGQYSTIEEHMPPNHRYHLSSYSPERFSRWAASIGPATQRVIDDLLASYVIVEQGFVPAANILGLARKGKTELLEKACAQIAGIGVRASYSKVKNTMAAISAASSAVRVPVIEDDVQGTGVAGRTRGADYYKRRV